MALVYILQSQVNFRYYIGSTTNLERRITEHNSGKSKYTSITRPFKIVFAQEFLTLNEALKIERKLKSFKSKKILESVIEDGIIKTGVD